MAVTRDQVVQWLEDQLASLLETHGKMVSNLEATIEEQAKEIELLKTTLQGPDRHDLQLNGKHPSPCAKFCEATAFRIDERRLRQQLKASQAREAQLREWIEKWCKFDSLNMDLQEWFRFSAEYKAMPFDDTALRE